MHGGLRGPAAGAAGCVAIHAVLGDVDVEAAQVDGAELVEGVINAVELEFFVGVTAGVLHFGQSGQDPAVDRGGLRFGGRVIAVEVAEKDAQGVADASVGIAEAVEHFLGEGDVVGEVDAADPQTHQIRAGFFHEVHCLGGLLVSALRRLRDFFPRVDVDDKSVGQACLVG